MSTFPARSHTYTVAPMASMEVPNFANAHSVSESYLSALEAIQIPNVRACGCKVFTDAEGKKNRFLCDGCKALYYVQRHLS